MLKRIGLGLLPLLLVTGVQAETQAAEPASVHAFEVQTIAGESLPLAELAGKVVVIVNTASRCGFTRQYADLVKLQNAHGDQAFTVLAFPANDFANQEPGSNEEIAAFCVAQFNINFPLMAKVSVRGDDRHPLFQLLTSASNPDFTGPIRWNFEKFLIDGEGQLRRRFRSKVTPMSAQFRAAVEELLAEASASDS